MHAASRRACLVALVAATLGVHGEPVEAGGATPPPLVIVAAPEPRLPDNFNPFAVTSSLYATGAPFYIYEPLVQYNELQDGQYYPWLAKSWAFSSSGDTVTFELRSGARWDDGSPFSAADVAYTFNLLKQYPDLASPLPIVSAVATTRLTFTLTLSRPAYSYLYYIAKVPIVKVGFAAHHDPLTYVDRAPDGTGPYVLAKASDATSSRVVLSARRSYWQGEPPVPKLVFPAYPDQAAVEKAFASGKVDWASFYPGNSQPGGRSARGTGYWFPPVNVVAFELNLAKHPEDQLGFREAVSDALDRTRLSTSATAGMEPPATSLSGLVLPRDASYLTAKDTRDVAAHADPARSAALMRALGYKRGARGYWTNQAGEIPVLGIQDPAGTLLGSLAGSVAAQLRAAGFPAKANLVSLGRWQSDLATGSFDSSLVAGARGPSPFYEFRGWLDASLVSHGLARGGDYEHLDASTDPSLAALASRELAAYQASPPGTAGEDSSLAALGNLVATYLPVVPLLYGVAWGEHSTARWAGWPTGSGPYEPPDPEGPYAEYTVLQLSPSSS